MKGDAFETEYTMQQRALDEIAGKLGVVAYRPDYHRKDRDKNTVLFYTREDEEHNRLVDKQPTRYTASEAADRMKYNRVEIPPEFVYRNSFWSFENSDLNGMLDYRFANYGKLDLRGIRWKDVLEGHIRLAYAKKMQFGYVRSIGGYWELGEADSTNNDWNREEIAAMRQIYGTVYLVDVNYFGERREKILAGSSSIFEEVTDAPVCNFAGSFCVPKKDPELEELILNWNRSDALPKKAATVDEIQERVAAIGGIVLVWS